MVFPAAEVAVAVLLILSMVVLLRLRRYIGSGERLGYSQMVLGLALLAATAIARGHFRMGNLEAVPFVGDPLVFHLIEWMLVITGSILLVSGLSDYLPAARHSRRFNRNQFRRLELIKRMDQLVAVESRRSDLLVQALQHIVHHYRMPGGVVFDCSEAGTPSCPGAAGECSVPDERRLRQVSFDLDILSKAEVGDPILATAISSWPQDHPQPDLVLPIRADNRIEAVYALFADEAIQTEDDLMNLKISLDTLSRKLRELRDQSRRQTEGRVRRRHEQLARRMDYTVGLRPNLTKLSEAFREDIPGATLVFLASRPDKCFDRCTVGANGAYLFEPGLTAERISPALLEVCCGKAARLVRLENDSTSELTRLGVTRAAVAPVQVGSKPRGALIVGWSDESEAPVDILERVSRTAPLLEPLVAVQSLRRENEQMEKRTAGLIGLMHRAARRGDLAGFLQEAAELITSELGASLVRISTFEADGRHLRSRSLSVSRACSVEHNDNPVMDLNSMPYHCLVRDTKRLMLINQEDTNRRIETNEARLIGNENLRSALLVPVVVGDLTLAVVSIADLGKWHDDRWDHATIQFVNTVAHMLALSIGMSLRRRDRCDNIENLRSRGHLNRDQAPQAV